MLGVIVTIGWYAVPPFTLLLAINRFVQMIFSAYVDLIFSRRATIVEFYTNLSKTVMSSVSVVSNHLLADCSACRYHLCDAGYWQRIFALLGQLDV